LIQDHDENTIFPDICFLNSVESQIGLFLLQTENNGDRCKITRPKRSFLPENFKVLNWDALKPYFDDY